MLGSWLSNAVRPWTDRDFLKSLSPLHHPVPQLHLFTDSSEEGSFVSLSVQVVTPNTSDISSSRLVAMQQHMEASGISMSVAR